MVNNNPKGESTLPFNPLGMIPARREITSHPYFTHGKFGSEIWCIDSALGFNSPADLVLQKAISLWRDRCGDGYLDRHEP